MTRAKFGARSRWPILAIWLAFLVRGAFYCAEQPLWEGFDEWAHFAYIQHIATHGRLPARTDPVSDEVRRSLASVPLSPSAAAIGAGTITFDRFWQSPAPRPASAPPIDARQYEAQQPPLYYVLLAPLLWLGRGLSLHAQVVLLRLVTMLIASSVVWCAYAAARLAALSESLALLAAALVATLPGFFINVCRVGNDGLAIALTSAAIVCALRDRPIALGAMLGLDLLAKSYALAFLPLIFFARRNRLLAAFAIPVAISGAWYWRVFASTGTLSGEQLDIAASRFTWGEKIAALAHVHWGTVLNIAAFSHIWMGGWSFLTVRTWMYRTCEAVAVLAAVSLAAQFWRSRARAVALLAAAWLLMCGVLAYFALVAFLTQNVETANGWYLDAAIVPEVVLLAIGLRARWAVAAACCGAAALDLYGMHAVLMPYYSGMLHHARDWSLMFQRLGVQPWLWFAYLGATLALAAGAVWLSAATSDGGPIS